MVTFDINGELEPGNIFFQVKATDKIRISKKQQAIEFTLSKKDLETWLSEPSIVVLVLYDAQNGISYFLDVQDYFNSNHIDISTINKFFRVFIDLKNVFTPDAVKELGQQKNQRLWI